MAEENLQRILSKCRAEMIRKVYEVDPIIFPRCSRTTCLEVISVFLTSISSRMYHFFARGGIVVKLNVT
jgi:hypothetical protein